MKPHQVDAEATKVSIPCKRESTCALGVSGNHHRVHTFPFPANGKAHVHEAERAALNAEYSSFHSLQTGKHMCTDARGGNCEDDGQRFHSLQTGKHMCTARAWHFLPVFNLVSIPCKRESTCAPRKLLPFTGCARDVSIPCKRESTCAHCSPD